MNRLSIQQMPHLASSPLRKLRLPRITNAPLARNSPAFGLFVTWSEFTQYTSPAVVPAFQVQAVDTTAAGDAFNGGLACALARGEALAEAIRYANAVAALTVTRMGAQPSLPTASELQAFLSSAPQQRPT